MKKTRWIACLIAVLLAVSLFPFGVFAESDDVCLAPVFCRHKQLEADPKELKEKKMMMACR